MSADLVFVEECRDLPLVHFQLAIPTGSLEDPDGLEGLTRLCARLMRRGVRGREARVIEETLDSLGAELAIDIAAGFVRLSGSTIRRSLEPTLQLVADMLLRPTFPEFELAQLKRETHAALVDLTDNDQGLSAMQFRRGMFAGHPYGRSSLGTPQSLAAIGLDQVRERYDRGLSQHARVFGFAGDLGQSEAESLLASLMPVRSGQLLSRVVPPAPGVQRGRRLRIIDKPERSQAQIYIGCLGTHPKDADHTALQVGNAIFGGLFSSRLTRAVRSERGWSYGASSRLAIDRVREAFSMWTFPALADAAPCIALQLGLLEELIERGVTQAELDFAKNYLAKSYAFSVDTAEKRLDQMVERELLDLPADYFTGHVQRVMQVTTEQVNAALRGRLSADDLLITIVATDAEIGAELRALPGIRQVEVLPFDSF